MAYGGYHDVEKRYCPHGDLGQLGSFNDDAQQKECVEGREQEYLKQDSMEQRGCQTKRTRTPKSDTSGYATFLAIMQ